MHFWNQRKKLYRVVYHIRSEIQFWKISFGAEMGKNDWVRIFKRMQQKNYTPDFKKKFFIL